MHRNILLVLLCCISLLVFCTLTAFSKYCTDYYKRYKTALMISRQKFKDREMTMMRVAQTFGTEFLLNDFDCIRQLDREKIIIREMIGSGAFGQVYKAELATDYGVVHVAVKENSRPIPIERAEDEFATEALIFSHFNHRNIVGFLGVNFDEIPRFIVLELMLGGDLKSFLRRARPKKETDNAYNMRQYDLVTMINDVSLGCEYLEAQRFIHRDIAARNCLLTSEGADRIVKIADFGMARSMYKQEYYRKEGVNMLPIKWMPPEALVDGFYTTRTDVWSFGVLMWEVFTMGCLPYVGRANCEVIDYVLKGGRLPRPMGCPDELYDLMLQCWAEEPDRPNFTYIVAKLAEVMEQKDSLQGPLPLDPLGTQVSNQTTPVVETPQSNFTVFTSASSPSSPVVEVSSGIPYCSNTPETAINIFRIPLAKLRKHLPSTAEEAEVTEAASTSQEPESEYALPPFCYSDDVSEEEHYANADSILQSQCPEPPIYDTVPEFDDESEKEEEPDEEANEPILSALNTHYQKIRRAKFQKLQR